MALISNEPGRVFRLPVTTYTGLGVYGTGLQPFGYGSGWWGGYAVLDPTITTSYVRRNIFANVKAGISNSLIFANISGSSLGTGLTQPQCRNGEYIRGGSASPIGSLPTTIQFVDFTIPTEANAEFAVSTPGTNTYRLVLEVAATTSGVRSKYDVLFDVVAPCAQPTNITPLRVGNSFIIQWSGPLLTNIYYRPDPLSNWIQLEADYVGDSYLIPPNIFQSNPEPQFRIEGVCNYGVDTITSVEVDFALSLPPQPGNGTRHGRIRR